MFDKYFVPEFHLWFDEMITSDPEIAGKVEEGLPARQNVDEKLRGRRVVADSLCVAHVISKARRMNSMTSPT